MKKIMLFLALSAVSVFADGIGIYAEGPAPQTNYGIIYSAGMFGIKNGYSYSNTHTENKNDTMTTFASDAMTATVEISPMLLLNSSILNLEIAPAYQLSISDTKSTTYSTFTAGSSTASESKPLAHIFKVNVLLTKVFAERYKLGVGTHVFRYTFSDTDNETKASTATASTKSTTSSSGYFDGIVQTFTTLSVATMMAELRKYRVGMVLANQHLSQLDPAIRDAVFGNAGTIVSFRVGAADGAFLAREFAPTFAGEDFISLPLYHIYVRLLIDGEPSHPFSATTLAPLP